MHFESFNFVFDNTFLDLIFVFFDGITCFLTVVNAF